MRQSTRIKPVLKVDTYNLALYLNTLYITVLMAAFISYPLFALNGANNLLIPTIIYACSTPILLLVDRCCGRRHAINALKVAIAASLLLSFFARIVIAMPAPDFWSHYTLSFNVIFKHIALVTLFGIVITLIVQYLLLKLTVKAITTAVKNNFFLQSFIFSLIGNSVAGVIVLITVHPRSGSDPTLVSVILSEIVCIVVVSLIASLISNTVRASIQLSEDTAS